jgi:chromosome segregation protein
MVYVKRVELSRFKSFGSTTSIPILPGFTVISGPNGSGKSNILDALLFCLGLASSKGMRAERLPDLVNHDHSTSNRTVETSVSVTFDLSDVPDLNLSLDFNSDSETNLNEPSISPTSSNTKEIADNSISISTPQSNCLEWIVTRKLKVTKSGSYSSSYFINDNPCTLSELHTLLNRLRIYPEGYNIVLQGDVTQIISMNSRERREIIDELAGVAEFDRKIEQTKKTLDAVKEREERCEIITEELRKNSDRLAADKIKAEKYQKLKANIQEKQQWEIVLNWRCLQQQSLQLEQEIGEGKRESIHLQQQLTNLSDEIHQITEDVDQLNQQVKELGEEEQINIASQLATQKAKLQQLGQHQQNLLNQEENLTLSCSQTQLQIEQDQQTLTTLTQEKSYLEQEIIPSQVIQVDEARSILNTTKEKAQAIASQSQIYVTKQTELSRSIAKLQDTLNPQLTQQALLRERTFGLQDKIDNSNQQLETIDQEIDDKQEEIIILKQEVDNAEEEIKLVARQLSDTESDLSLNQETINRLTKEQRENQRKLDKLEATSQAQQEAQGTYATKIILQSELPGVCGLVAQLGQVEPSYQLALEIAAGGRLGYIVVEDDSIASAGIQLLKQQRAGRATFLPLNKIQAKFNVDTRMLKTASGFVDLAVNLINCETKYHNIFAYVFGNTVVFETLAQARSYLGRYRIVTLDGEILEISGAMTGGSVSARSSLHFGTVNLSDSQEMETLSDRLRELEELLERINESIPQKKENVKNLTENLHNWRQKRQKSQLILEQNQQKLGHLENQKQELTAQVATCYQQLIESKKELAQLEEQIPILQTELTSKQRELRELEASHNNQEWLNIQAQITIEESNLEVKQQELNHNEAKLQTLLNNCLRLEEKNKQNQDLLRNYATKKDEVKFQQKEIQQEIDNLRQKIDTNDDLFKQLALKLEQIKIQRDEMENLLKFKQNQQQKAEWQLEKLREKQQDQDSQLKNLTLEIEAIERELPLPEISCIPNQPDSQMTLTNLQEQLEQIQKEIKNGQKRLEAMEPVNMLALEEYENNQKRLQELSEKLATLKAERTELLLRIEHFTTLRSRAFKEAFDSVNENFSNIFATLSEGDGFLQLDDPENPFNGGLNLVAHPKGKPVQRLSSMSGGEKSLTALSFIFALQRYRPSPFYAFDEVDMFLDGANVEKLSRMIRQQSEQAQFIVVSLRRPMIEAAERTIGVTQARGAHTQVLGIKL